MLVPVIVMSGVPMTVMQIVDVIAMGDRLVTAVETVLMQVPFGARMSRPRQAGAH